jgi:endonuclease G
MRLALLVLLLVSSSAYSNDCNGHLKFAVQDKEGDVDLILCKGGYAVGYSFFYKAPIWVSYKLTGASVTPDNGRGGDPFAEDEFIPAEARSTLWDYKYSGWDRGHMAPRAAMDSTPDLRDESFLMSNMTPQHPQLNQRGWKELEGYVRSLAIEFDEIYVVTGALFKGINRTIGRGVYIPSHVYKAIHIPSENQVLAFVVPNEPFDIDDLDDAQETVNYIENRSGLQLFNEIPNALENQIEKVEIDYCTGLAMGSLQIESCP